MHWLLSYSCMRGDLYVASPLYCLFFRPTKYLKLHHFHFYIFNSYLSIYIFNLDPMSVCNILLLRPHRKEFYKNYCYYYYYLTEEIESFLHSCTKLKLQTVLSFSSFVHNFSINEHKNMKLRENICYEKIYWILYYLGFGSNL